MMSAREACVMREVTPADPPRPHPHPGLFLVLEGPDGGGKTTQAARLAAWLRGEGLDVVVCRDPGSTEVGNRLRDLVMSRTSTHLGLRSEMLIYMASRAQLVDEVIQPALKAGRVVISDRFLLSNIVYQGFAGGLPVEDLWQIGQVATGGLLPDLTLILDVPSQSALDRVGPGRDRIEDRPHGYRERVREGYLDASRDRAEGEPCPYYPVPVVLVDATGDPDAVFGSLQHEVERVLALGPRG
jgi:dTMP kinase